MRDTISTKTKAVGWYVCVGGTNGPFRIHGDNLSDKPPTKTLTIRERTPEQKEAKVAVTTREMELENESEYWRRQVIQGQREHEVLSKRWEEMVNDSHNRATQLADDCGKLKTDLDRANRILIALRGEVSLLPDGAEFLKDFDNRYGRSK
ncbi:MAG: hypothetical protein ACYTEQ_05225 [Planctomycetota bacterium]|jgi:hypothetical protein